MPEQDLPVILPEDCIPDGSGNPLNKREDFLACRCPVCGQPSRRETDTMDTFVDSSWYFMRYCDARDDTAMVGEFARSLVDVSGRRVSDHLFPMILKGQGFQVEDLGVSVTTEQFVDAVREKRPEILAMSALLTTTMIEMRNTINALKSAGFRDRVKVVVGGAPVTPAFAEQIGADGNAYDAPGAAKLCKNLLL